MKITSNKINKLADKAQDFNQTLEDALRLEARALNKYKFFTLQDLADLTAFLEDFNYLRDIDDDESLNYTIKMLLNDYENLDSQLRDILPRIIFNFFETLPDEVYNGKVVWIYKS